MLVEEPAQVNMRSAYTFLGRTRNAVEFFLFVSLLNYTRFVVWVVTWLCLAHIYVTLVFDVRTHSVRIHA